jgi:ribosome biogenesis SPOUT family RNA methylase Rps3
MKSGPPVSFSTVITGGLLSSRQPNSRTGNNMNGSELQQIEQRISEGYYEADADALGVMTRLVAEIRRFREEIATETPELELAA